MLLLSRKINDRLSSLWCKHCSKPLNRNDAMKMFTMPFSIGLKYEEKWNKNDFILGKDEKKKLIIQALNCWWPKYAFQGTPIWFLRGQKWLFILAKTNFFVFAYFHYDYVERWANVVFQIRKKSSVTHWAWSHLESFRRSHMALWLQVWRPPVYMIMDYIAKQPIAFIKFNNFHTNLCSFFSHWSRP